MVQQPEKPKLSFATAADASEILAIFANPAMARYSPIDDISEEEFRQLLVRNPSSFAESGHYYRLIAKAEDQLVGTILVKCEDPNRVQVEIGYAIRADHQGRGFGQRMVAAACELIFTRSPFSIIWAKVHKDNFASIAILAKIGFTERWTEPCGELLVYCLEHKP